MARSVLEIVFRTLKEGTGDRETKAALKDLEKNFKGLMSVGGAVVGVLTTVGATLNKGYQEFQAYAGQVRDLALASGTTATEASKLLQVLDDFEISAQDVTTATKAMTKAGLAPTIDTLAKLSDEYLSINGAQARNEFLLKNLGKAGLQWVNVLNQGSAAIRASSDEVNKNLILTDEQIEMAEKSRLAVDAWADAWQGFKVQVGAAVGELIVNSQEAAEKQEYLAMATGMNFDQQKRMQGALNGTNAEYERAIAMGAYWEQQLGNTTEEIAAQTEAIENQKESNKTYFDTLMRVQTETDNFTEKNDALKLKLQELYEEQAKTSEWSSKYQELQTEIDATTGEIDKLASEHEMAGKRIAFALLQQKIMSGDATAAQIQGLVDVGVNWGILDETTAETTMKMIHNVEALGDAMLDPNNQLKIANQQANQLKNKSGMMFDFFVNIHTSGSWPSLPVTMGGGGGGGPGTGAAYEARAGGGQLGGGYTLVGERGAELITPSGFVIPADVTRALLASGLMPQFQMAIGGSIPSLDGQIVGVPYHTQTGGTTVNKPRPGGLPPPVVTAEVSQASQVASAVVPMAEATVAAVQTSAQAQQQASAEAVQTREVISTGNAETNSLLKDMNNLLKSQQANLTRAMIAAFQQANP